MRNYEIINIYVYILIYISFFFIVKNLQCNDEK